jgi:hypothetical protein
MLRAIAASTGFTLRIVRDKGPHTVYAVGGQSISVPRHTEINEHTARGIIQTAEQVPAREPEGEK